MVKKQINTKKYIFNIGIFLLFVFVFGYFYSKRANASWFDDGWRYRVAIPISAHTAAENGVYLTLTGTDGINTTDTTKFQTDCGDIRFTTENGDILPYYLTTACGLAQTGFHVYFASFPAGAQTIYYYYNNPGAPNGFSGADFLTAASAVTLGTRGSETSSPASPVVYYRFDEGSGQTVNNAIETTRTGSLGPDATVTATDPSWASSDLCISSNCLSFLSTSSQYINVSGSIASVKSIGFWVRPTTTTTSLAVLNGAAGNASISVSSGTISAGAGFTSPTIYVNGVVSSTLAANTWQYVVVTTGTGITASNIMLGRVNAGYLNGFMDEVKVYGVALSSSQVKANYGAGLAKNGQIKGSSVSFGSTTTSTNTLSNGLVGYWKMDEVSGNAADSSGNVLTLTNNGTTPFLVGKIGNSAGSFNGSSMYFSTATSVTGVQTISFWVKPASNTNNYFNLASGKYLTSSSGTLTATGFTSPTIYVNGVLSSTVTASVWQMVTVVDTAGITANAIEVGRANGSYFSSGGFIDDFRIYNRALTESEVLNLYNWEPSPKAYWKLDDSAGTTAVDSSGNNFSGTITNGPSWNSGKIGSSLYFDGVDDYVDVGDSFYSDTLSISAWVKVTSLGVGNKSIVVKRNASGITGGSNEYELVVKSTGAIEFGSWDSGGVGIVNTVSTTLLSLNTWYHVEIAYGGNGGVSNMYINGVLEASTAVAAVIGDQSSRIQLGTRSANNDARYFNGYMDDVKIYNYARTQKQVVADMNTGKPKPVGYWKFDEGNGTTTYDSNNDVGGTENLTLSTGTSSWSNSGKFGKAFSGGGSRWLTRADDANLDFKNIEGMVINFWMKSSIASAANPSATEYIVNKPPTGAANGGYAVYANTSGQVCFGIDDDNTSFPEDSTCSSVDVYDNNWHQITAVKTSNTKLEIFVDTNTSGTPDTSISSNVNTLENTSSFFVASANAVNDTDDFNGDLDELTIFRDSSSTQDIYSLKNFFNAASLGSSSVSSANVSDMSSGAQYCVPGDSSTCTGPIGEWKMEENTGTSAFDTSGNGYTGVLSGDAVWGVGKMGSGIKMDGNGDIVTVTNSTAFDFGTSTAFTFNAWVKLGSNGASDQTLLITSGDVTGKFKVFVSNASSKVRAYIGTGATFCTLDSTNTVLDSKWHFISVVFNRNASCTTSDILIYIDGIKETTSVTAATVNTNTAIDTGAILFGRGTAESLSGTIDHVKLYNYARSAAQIAWDYNLGDPIAWWRLNECSGAALNDSMGNIAAGTIVPAAGTNTAVGTCGSGTTSQMWDDGTTGKINSSLGFDNSDDAVTFTADTRLNLTSGGTIMAWIKPGSTGENSFGRIIDKSSDTAGTGGYIFGMNGNAIYGEMTNAGNTSCSSATNSVSFSQWSHAAWVFDGTDWRFYVNGVLSNTCTTSKLPSATSLGVTIGNRQGATDRTFDGLIDDVRIYGYPLTIQQIKSAMNGGSVQIAPSTGSAN